MSAAPIRRILIMHGVSADSRNNWYRSVGAHFEAMGCEVLIPNLPMAHAPNLNRWSDTAALVMDEAGWSVDERLSLIGHSTGSLAALRFIERLPDGARVGPCILVAGFPAAFLHPKLPTIVARTPRPEMIKPKAPQILAVHSTNDWRVPTEPNANWLKRELDAEILEVEEAGHFITRSGWADWNAELYEKAESFLGITPASQEPFSAT